MEIEFSNWWLLESDKCQSIKKNNHFDNFNNERYHLRNGDLDVHNVQFMICNPFYKNL